MSSFKFSFRTKVFSNFPLSLIIIFFLSLQSNLYSQQNTSFEITGGFAKSQESGMGTIVTFSNRINGNFFITVSTGYLSFRNSEKEYNPFRFGDYEIPVTKEKFIIPLEIGGLIEFGEQKFRPFIKFDIGYNYTEYFVYSFKEVPGNPAANYRPVVVSDYRTHIAASYGIGMGAFYFINDGMKIGINFMMQDITNINKYVRLMAGVSYII